MAFEGLGTIHNTPHSWLVMHNNVGRSFLFFIFYFKYYNSHVTIKYYSKHWDNTK